MEHIPTEIREKAYLVCREYLGGEWLRITQNEIIIEKFSGGYLNLTFKLSLSPNYTPIKGEPSHIIMKIYQNGLGEGYFRFMTENIIAVILSEKKLAPKVYGVFDGGRLDEFIISRPLVTEDLHNPNIICAIARKLAHFHSVSFPISKNPNKFYNQTKSFMDIVLNDPRTKNDPTRNTIVDKIRSTNPYDELKWLKEIIDSSGSPVVYCHGDLQVNNILLTEDSLSNSVHIIDLDISGYNYRGHDFASLTNGFCFVVPYSEPPYMKCAWEQYPSLDEQKLIFTIYLQEYQRINNIELDIEQQIQSLVKETQIFRLLFLYFHVAFFVGKKDDPTTNKLGWLELVHVIFDEYQELKNKFQS